MDYSVRLDSIEFNPIKNKVHLCFKYNTNSDIDIKIKYNIVVSIEQYRDLSEKYFKENDIEYSVFIDNIFILNSKK